MPKWFDPVPAPQNHLKPRPCTSAREFDVSLDCVWLSGLTLRRPKRVLAGRLGTIFFFVLKRLSRTHNDLRTPQRPGAALVEPTGWGFQAEVRLGGAQKKSFFFSPLHDALGCVPKNRLSKTAPKPDFSLETPPSGLN